MQSLELPESDEVVTEVESVDGPTSGTVVGSAKNYTPADIHAIDDKKQLRAVYAFFAASKLMRAFSLRYHALSYFGLPLPTVGPSALL